jgi:hypothetical protein
VPAKIKTEAEFQQRFWEKVNKTSTCWWWTGARNNLGYGFIRRRPKTYSAHRLSWTFANGPIEDSLWVLHKCDNPSCVNPDHLFLGTHRDNERDKTEKGRAHRIGTRNAKLTEEQVREIRVLSAAGLSQRKIASQFGVTQVTICNVQRGRSYSYVS